MSNRRLPNPDLENVVDCVFLLVVLCAGEPDLLDAIIAWIARQP